MKKVLINRIARLFVGLFFLLCFMLYAYLTVIPGIDYTNEYAIYNDISNLSNLDEIENYLDENRIDYSIEESTLKLTDYDNIKCIIGNDNISCKIIHSDLMNRLSKLDKIDYDTISVEKITVNGEVTEKLSFEKGIHTYSKINGHYYTNTTILYKWTAIISLIVSILKLLILIVDVTCDFFNYLKKKRDEKSVKNNSPHIDLKDESNQI